MTAQAPDPPSPLLTVKEAAAIMRVSAMTVYRMIEDGELRGIRLGRSIRVSRQALAEKLGDLWPADAQ